MKCRSIALFLCLVVFLIPPLYGKDSKNSALNKKIDLKLNQNGKTPFYLDFRTGFAFPVNASYIDTFENQDIYWNPNSGLSLDIKFVCILSDILWLTLPVDSVLGLYQYTTTDGRKVNTEAQAGNTPETVNTEWSFAPSFTPMLMVKLGKQPGAPYIGVGAGIGLMWSYESWSFTNVDDNGALLTMTKTYWPALVFKGETGINIKLRNRLAMNISGNFTVANYVMKRVQLDHYYINGADTIGEYDIKDLAYTYGYDVPDENKGGDCLLAGFTYNNYPQEKIGTNFTVKIGLVYHL